MLRESGNKQLSMYSGLYEKIPENHFQMLLPDKQIRLYLIVSPFQNYSFSVVSNRPLSPLRPITYLFAWRT